MSDEKIKEKALDLMSQGYIYWSKVADLEEEAESPETKRFVHGIAVSMYRREEATCGLL